MEHEATIPGVTIRPLKVFTDARGWLSEVFRTDELGDYRVEMGYVSVTLPGIARGPHEHKDQTDYFCFFGSFTLYLWDNRKESPAFGAKQVIGNADRLVVTVPPGVVHAYRNSGTAEAMVLNFPDRLFAGKGKKEAVDEIRYENDPSSPFQVG